MVKKLLVALSLIIFLAVPAFARGFKTSDMAGSWYIYSIEVDPAMPAVYWVRGYFEVDDTGNITSGTYYAPDGSTVNLSSGQIRLNFQGVISGSLNAQGETATVVSGRLDQSKTMGTAVLLGSDQSMDIVTFIKGGGIFTTKDLEGTWYIYQTVIDPSTGAVFWIYGAYTSDASGKVTSGSFSGPDGSTVTVSSGTVSANSSGIVNGNLALSNGQAVTIVHGKIDRGKTKGVGVGVEPDGSMAMAFLVKAGGIFESTDVGGKSNVYGLLIDPSIPAVFWVYGDIRISDSGNYTGSYKAPTGVSGTGTGTVTIDTTGVITGTGTFDTDDQGMVFFKEDQGKTSRVGVSVTASGLMGIWQFYDASPVTMSALPLLLLED